MAVFNPQVQLDQGQVYIGLSKPSSEAEGDKSSGMAMAAAGNAIEGATSIADTTVKKAVSTDVHDQFDTIQNKYVTDLQNANAVLDPNKSLMTGDSTGAPADVQKGLDFLSRNQAAFTANKISKTEYDRNLYQMATSLRSKYLGYRDYVDEEVHKITGGVPANEYVNSLVSDANKILGRAQSETDKWQTFIKSKDSLPGAAEMYQYYQKTGDSNRVMEWAAYNDGVENSLKLKKLNIDVKNASRGDLQNNAEDYVTSLATQRIGQTIHNAKLTTDSPDFDKIESNLKDAAAHPGKYSDQEVQLLGQQYAAIQADITNHIQREVFTKDPKTGKSPADFLGVQKTRDIVNNTVGAYFDAQQKAIGDRQFGTAYSNANRVSAIANGDAPMAVLGSSAGTEMALSAAINRLNPNMAPVLQQQLMPGLGAKAKPLIDSLSKRAISQFDTQKTGIPRTFSEDVDTVKKAINNTPNPNAYRSLQNLTSIITSQDPDVPDEAKTNAITYFFDPHNAGVLKKFQRDDVKPDGKTAVPTQYSTYLRLTSPDVTDAIWNHAKKTGNPELWQNYSTWAKGEFGSQLFKNDVLELNNMQGNSENYDKTPMVHFEYQSDPKTGKVRINPAYDNGNPYPQGRWLDAPYRVTNNINYGLDALSNIAKKEGSNVDAYLLKTMSDAGWDPNKPMQGVPAQLMKALLISKGVYSRDQLDKPTAPDSK